MDSSSNTGAVSIPNTDSSSTCYAATHMKVPAGTGIRIRHFNQLAFLLALTAFPQSCFTQSLWNHLKPGPYPIGFRSSIEVDYSRRELTYPQLPSTKLPNFRPILVAIWYPAAEASTMSMKYSDYLDTPALPEWLEFSQRLKQFGQETAQKTLFKKENLPLSQEELSSFNQIFQERSRASRNVLAAQKRFPVIFYHAGAGGSFEENAVLFEFLASHGYVVVSSAFQANAMHVSNNMHFEHTEANDLRFLIQYSSQLPFVDIQKSAAIGHSAGAQFLLKFIGDRTSILQSMVSLDTTLEHTYSKLIQKEIRPFQKFRERFVKQLGELTPPAVPVMLFSSLRADPNFSIFDPYLKNSSRYEVILPDMRHDDYVTHGVLRSVLPSSNPGEEKELTGIRQSYDNLCRLTLLFLDSVLKGHREAEQLLKNDPNQSGPSAFSVRYRAPQKMN